MFVRFNYFKTVLSAKLKLEDNKGEIGLGQVVGIAIILIVVAFVTIPLFRSFASTVFTSLNRWWADSVGPTLFPES